LIFDASGGNTLHRRFPIDSIDRQVLTAFAGRILPLHVATVQRCASLHVPNPCSERDAMIAATALCNGLRVVTRNVADFTTTGVEIINPFD
jgi:toxin FitB